MGGSHGQFSIKVMIHLLTGQYIAYVVQTVLNWMYIYMHIHPDCIEYMESELEIYVLRGLFTINIHWDVPCTMKPPEDPWRCPFGARHRSACPRPPRSKRTEMSETAMNDGYNQQETAM